MWQADLARGMAVCPNTTSYRDVHYGGYGGYLVDAYGGIHNIGDAPAINTPVYWPGADNVRGVALRPDCLSGYMLDLSGGLWPFAVAGTPNPPTYIPSGKYAYWPGQNITRAIVYLGRLYNPSDGTTLDSGYDLDLFGGVHPWGNAPATSGYPYWSGHDLARALTLYAPAGISAGYLLDAYGGVSAGGGAPGKQSQSAYWSGFDTARGIAIWPGALTGYFIDTSGVLQTFTVYSTPCCLPSRQ
jgi:hypothetical protein